MDLRRMDEESKGARKPLNELGGGEPSKAPEPDTPEEEEKYERLTVWSETWQEWLSALGPKRGRDGEEPTTAKRAKPAQGKRPRQGEGPLLGVWRTTLAAGLPPER